MANDVEITVRVSNQTAAGLQSVNQSLRGLKTNARDAGQALNGLTTRAAAAAAALQVLQSRADAASRSLRELRGRAAAADAALRDLRDGTTNVGNSLRTLNTRAQTADGRLGDLSDRTRTLRSDMDDLDGSLRRVIPNMNGLRGSLGTLRTSTVNANGGMRGMMMTAIALAPALIPVGAVATMVGAKLVAGLGAGTAAVVAFGAALVPQILAMSKIGEAQKKYTEAVAQHGKSSEEATKAEAAWLKTVEQADPAVREAAAALAVMKEQYKDWSTSLQGDTLPVATKSFAVMNGIVQQLTPTVKGASSELNRFMTIAGGGVASSGFERMMNQFADFAEGSLRKANNGLVHMMRMLSTGQMSGGGLATFIQYAKENGPLVGDALRNIGDALMNLLEAASNVGVGLLQVISAFASLVSALPTGLITTLLQLVLVFKAVKMAAAGMAVAGTFLAAFRVQLLAASTAAAASSGVLAALGAAFMALSRTAKIAVAGSGIGLVVVALSELANLGKRAPADVDKMATSLAKFAKSGELSGEALKVSGKDFKAFDEAMNGMVERGTWDKMQQGFTSLFGQDSTPVKRWKADLDDIDKGLAQMVKDGNADLAAAALKRYVAHAKSQGHTSEEVTRQLGDYRSALADLKFENELIADSMGLFGEQAIAVQGKLDAQKASADGLAQSINALSDAALTARGSFRSMEAAMDAADEAYKKNGETLDEGTEKGRANNQALDDLAAATKKAAEAARANGASWAEVNGIYDTGRAKLVAVADQMGLTKAQAEKLADQILRTPDKTARLKGNMDDLQAKLSSARRQLKSVPDSRKARVTANIDALNYSLAKARDALNALDGKVATTYVVTQHSSSSGSGLKGLPYADGGMVRGPGSGTSDDVPIMASNGEFVVNAASTQKHRKLLEAINRNQLPGFAKGGKVSKAEQDARNQARGDFTISHFGRMAGATNTEARQSLANPGSVGALVGALNGLRGVILKSTHGGTEKSLLKQLDNAGKALIKHEKNLEKVNKELAKAKDKLADLKQAASQMASSVKEGVLSSASITRGAGGDRPMTVAGIMGGLTQSRDQATAFAKALKDLKAKGVSTDLIGQIAEAGIGGGGLETAGALLSASSSEIASINALQKEIGKAAGDAGKAASDAMYGAGIKAAEGLVRGLTAQQDKIEAAMMKIAKSMEKAIKQALGIKSPSKVMEQVGHHTAEGFARGIEGNRRTDAAWASMLNVPRTVGAGSAGGRREPIVIEFRSSGSEFDEFLMKSLRRSVRNLGSDVQFIFTGRKAP